MIDKSTNGTADESAVTRLIREASASALHLVMLLPAVFVAIVSIGEIAAREAAMGMISDLTAQRRTEFATESYAALRHGANWGEDKPKAILSPQEIDNIMARLGQMDELDQRKSQLRSLITLGPNRSDFSLRGILSVLEHPNLLPGSAQFGPSADLRSNFVSEALNRYAEPIVLLSSDHLFAVAIVACGAIGAMAAAIRGNIPLTLRSLSLGLAVGFVVYLAIKGGKSVFLMQSQGEIFSFNPYGCGFAAILAGLFSERAHSLLTTLVDDFAARLKLAIGNHSK